MVHTFLHLDNLLIDVASESACTIRIKNKSDYHGFYPHIYKIYNSVSAVIHHYDDIRANKLHRTHQSGYETTLKVTIAA